MIQFGHRQERGQLKETIRHGDPPQMPCAVGESIGRAGCLMHTCSARSSLFSWFNGTNRQMS
jgi:hypothetical protein